MAWFLNPALTRFRAEVNSRWPRRDKASDGTIGDAAHAARSSDHNEDPDGSVDAWDMDVDGVDVAACKKVFQAHEASKYWVHNDQIAFRDEGWRPRSYAYAGPNRNRHTQHCHWNTREAYENSTRPWFTTDVKIQGDDMSGFGFKEQSGFRLDKTYEVTLTSVAPAVVRIEANLKAIAGKDWVDEQAIVNGVLTGLGGKSAWEIRAALQAALPPGTYAELFPQG